MSVVYLVLHYSERIYLLLNFLLIANSCEIGAKLPINALFMPGNHEWHRSEWSEWAMHGLRISVTQQAMSEGRMPPRAMAACATSLFHRLLREAGPTPANNNTRQLMEGDMSHGPMAEGSCLLGSWRQVPHFGWRCPPTRRGGFFYNVIWRSSFLAYQWGNWPFTQKITNLY
jgi:hypothetical protein